MMKIGRKEIKTAVIKSIGNAARCLILLGMAGMLTGCHGSKGMQSFEIPEEFDESKQYEITFWAKNDTNKTQTAVYEKAIEDFEKKSNRIADVLRVMSGYIEKQGDKIK